MGAAGRLHLIATMALVVTLAGVTLAQAGLRDTPANSRGLDRATQGTPPAPDRFQVDGASGGEN